MPPGGLTRSGGASLRRWEPLYGFIGIVALGG